MQPLPFFAFSTWTQEKEKEKEKLRTRDTPEAWIKEVGFSCEKTNRYPQPDSNWGPLRTSPPSRSSWTQVHVTGNPWLHTIVGVSCFLRCCHFACAMDLLLITTPSFMLGSEAQGQARHSRQETSAPAARRSLLDLHSDGLCVLRPIRLVLCIGKLEG